MRQRNRQAPQSADGDSWLTARGTEDLLLEVAEARLVAVSSASMEFTCSCTRAMSVLSSIFRSAMSSFVTMCFTTWATLAVRSRISLPCSTRIAAMSLSVILLAMRGSIRRERRGANLGRCGGREERGDSVPVAESSSDGGGLSLAASDRARPERRLTLRLVCYRGRCRWLRLGRRLLQPT